MTPVYEYKCKCGATTTKMRKISERDDICNCENCGKPARRVVSTGSFKIKGSSAANGYMSNNKEFNRRNK